MKAPTKNISNIELLEKGWTTLVRALGPEDARAFIFSFPRKKGDSVKYWKNFWKGKTVEEIYRSVIKDSQ